MVFNFLIVSLPSQGSQVRIAVMNQSLRDETSYSQVQLLECFQGPIGPFSTSFARLMVLLHIAIVVVGQKNISPVRLAVRIMSYT
jgi:hypothetical protein